MLIRELNLADAGALRNLRALVDAGGTLGPESERLRALTPEGIEQLLRPPYETVGAFVGEKLLGSASLYQYPVEPFDPFDVPWFALAGVIVHPLACKQGIGRKLVVCRLNRMQELGAHGVSLLVNVPNPAAMALYESLGFQSYEVNEGAYVHNGQRYDEVTMRLRFASLSSTGAESP
ncbi:GNAT family N-acetyltransferase [Alicycliphilus denitrificans]|uniref:GNAT family N-acetyltransferase n=1 Tax=Alicycliphilus denitrificans TaxID=179636 RepID=UPI00384F39CF